MENQLLVIFGASGDLTQRKLIPALFALFKQQLLPGKFAILGISRSAYSNEEYKLLIRTAISAQQGNADKEVSSFLELIHYYPVETKDPESYIRIRDVLLSLDSELGLSGNCIFYLSTPPSMYETISQNLAYAGLTKHTTGWRRIIVEKPIGYNLITSRQLNQQLLQSFTEDQIYRIDHYLGKESVQNIMVTRFSNGIFEPLWNRNFVNHVEITSAENLGVGKRGGYYDHAGALRDMVQNHLLQLLSLIAMEPPTRIQSDAIRNEMLKVLQAVRPLNSRQVRQHVIRGQYTESVIRGKTYPAYREEYGVAKDSHTETYVALKLFIDNWRWGDVPFYIRTGKHLPTRVTEIVIHFKTTPHKLFCFDKNTCNSDNQLVMRIQPDEGILLKFGMKVPGAGFHVQDVNMDFHYSDLRQAEIPEAYQRLLLDCMQGDSTLFSRGDAIEQSWEIIEPILQEWEHNTDIPLYGYPSGTWGPLEADDLIEDPAVSWRYPCKNLSEDGVYCEL